MPRQAEINVSELLMLLWNRYRDRLWTVAELRQLGYVAEADTKRLGYALSTLARRGGRVGALDLHRVGLERDGAVYQLTAR